MSPAWILPVVFVCAVENEEFGNGSVLVREEHRKLWRGIPRSFSMNMRGKIPSASKTLRAEKYGRADRGSGGTGGERKLLKEIPMYVLSNQRAGFRGGGAPV